MKNSILLILSFCLLGLIQAQKKGGHANDSARKAALVQLQEYRKQLFATELGIENEKLDKFFTVYNPYLEKVNNAKRNFKKKWANKDVDNLSETEANEYLNDVLTLRENEVTWLKEVSNALKPILPVSKIIQLPKIEKKVKRKMLLKAREMKKANQN